MPWKNYQRASMRHTNAFCKILIRRTGNLHDVSCRLLQWHPTHFLLEELAEFLAFDLDVGLAPTFRFGWRPEDPVDVVLYTCPSLLAVVKPGDSAVIQISHFGQRIKSTRLLAPKNTISLYRVSRTRSSFRDASPSGHSATPERKGHKVRPTGLSSR